MKTVKNSDITWIEFDVKRKMKRTFSEAKLKKYIFGEEYKERPKEHKKFLQSVIRDAKKTIAERATQRLIREAEGETDTVYLDMMFGAGWQGQRLQDAEEKLISGNYLQTAEDFAYHKEWTARWTYFEACCYNFDVNKERRTLLWDEEYRFQTYGYDWDKHTGILTYEESPARSDKKQVAEFRRKWS